jgi:hypothetical protein
LVDKWRVAAEGGEVRRTHGRVTPAEHKNQGERSLILFVMLMDI